MRELLARGVLLPLYRAQRSLRPSRRAAMRHARDGRDFRSAASGWSDTRKRDWILAQLRAVVRRAYRDTIFYADDWTWYQLMQRSGRAGLLVQVHAENDAIVEGRARQLLAAGSRSLAFHAQSRPAVA